jgi:hypothetical protein
MAVEWILAKYGSSQTAMLATGLRMVVAQNIGTRGGPSPKWRATVFEAALKAEFDDCDAAKKAAERAARSWMAKATEALVS